MIQVDYKTKIHIVIMSMEVGQDERYYGDMNQKHLEEKRHQDLIEALRDKEYRAAMRLKTKNESYQALQLPLYVDPNAQETELVTGSVEQWILADLHKPKKPKKLQQSPRQIPKPKHVKTTHHK